MPKTFERTRKAIAKKKGAVDSLHQYSRDSKRLHRAQVRDGKLEKIAASRKKSDKPYLERATFFQEAVRQNGSQPVQMDVIHELIKTFVHQHDEELSEVKKTRRPGRPASAKEDLLKVKIDKLQKEYQNGFLIPELDTEENATVLSRWEGSWSYLTTLKWVRISSAGSVQPSSFPPRGEH
ncbi:translation machinery-associated protein 16 [Daldinia loculata]|uniref:translation machinery-associated protein 16 n=1 Tax=Daldinia loculata TaxID=103429 RepID=UPI0020C4A8E9|nr:translation machinery-associated protein 16 [Daldinia loculata]KAI1645127.1 translation machinery-associated protein 16 [Daldinia loculata]KAI2779987.1 translation machinery-associated protein 16 [Daldinia loculata]